MSQRSHVASSGRRPIAACSAAWADPGTSSCAIAEATASASRVHQTALVCSVRWGRSSSSSPSIPPPVVLRFVYDTTWWTTSTEPNDIAAAPHCSVRSVAMIAISVTDLAIVE